MDAKKIPNFIDAKKQTHHSCYILMQSIFDTYVELANPKVLNDLTITTIVLDVTYDCNLIVDTLIESISQSKDYEEQITENNRFYFKIITYLQSRVDYYLKAAVELEAYEAAANIKKYLSFNEKRPANRNNN
jgi:hypothetical protein